tara:strand:+ start:1325 stop:1636 length:312 start_codon:yes stop_codon:yes gene_type:complete
MTFVYEKTFGKFDSSTNFEGNKLIVEYVHSSVSDSIKVVEMWRVGEDEWGEVKKQFHRLNWMSKEGRESLMAELEEDMTDRMCMTGKYAPLDEEDYLTNIGAM